MGRVPRQNFEVALSVLRWQFLMCQCRKEEIFNGEIRKVKGRAFATAEVNTF